MRMGLIAIAWVGRISPRQLADTGSGPLANAAQQSFDYVIPMQNIGAAVHYQPIHMLRFYQEKYGYSPDDYPYAYQIGEHVLSLPLSASMSEADARDVAMAVRKVATACAQ